MGGVPSESRGIPNLNITGMKMGKREKVNKDGIGRAYLSLIRAITIPIWWRYEI